MVPVFDDGGRDFETQQTLRLGNPAKAENVVLNHRNKVPSNKNQQTESLSQMMELLKNDGNHKQTKWSLEFWC